MPEVLVRGWTFPVESVRMWMYIELGKVAPTECANLIFVELTMKRQGDLEYRLDRSIPSGRNPGPSTKAPLECHANQKEIAA